MTKTVSVLEFIVKNNKPLGVIVVLVDCSFSWFVAMYFIGNS